MWRRRVCRHAHLGDVEAYHLFFAGRADSLDPLLNAEERVHDAEGPSDDHDGRDGLSAVEICEAEGRSIATGQIVSL